MTDRRRQVPAWPRGPERPNRDPERLRPAPPHPGFKPLPLDMATDVCRLCRALVPATDLARARHQEWDAKVVMAATVALANQLSGGSGSPAQEAPTPPHAVPEFGHSNRGGVEGANPQDNRPGASGEAPNSPDATTAPAGPTVSTPPGGSSGAPKRPGRDGGARGKPPTAPAGADPELVDLTKYERTQAAQGWTR